jgi:hypothetical protein
MPGSGIGGSLERSGLIERDIDNAYLAFDPGEEAPIHGLLGSSITYRIATGPREGQKVFTLQTLPAQPDAPRPEVAESSGFSLHAGLAAKASQRDKLERLARYVSRPPVATERLSLTQAGNVRYALKTPYRDGTTHVIFEPEEFMAHIPVRHPFGAAYGRANRQSCRFVIARLAALVPKPRAHLTRYHGVFAPASPERAQRLKRVFAIDIETCRECGGELRVIASIEEPAVIERILEHLRHTAEPVDTAHPSRAPPKGDRLV